MAVGVPGSPHRLGTPGTACTRRGDDNIHAAIDGTAPGATIDVSVDAALPSNRVGRSGRIPSSNPMFPLVTPSFRSINVE